jgi:hypothetical protein
VRTHFHGSLLYILLLILVAGLLSAFQVAEPVRETTVLYDGRLGDTPDQQNLSYIALFTTAAGQRYEDGVTILDTWDVAADQAGYFGPSAPVLNRELGYTLHFSGQVLREKHKSRHRAGFTLLVVSDDLVGLELAFWENEIWAQEGGNESLFTHAEGAAFDTTAEVTEYELAVFGDGYTLSAGGAEILSGALRDYTAFDGFPDVYEEPNLVFLGDNTRRAQAETSIRYVAVESANLATSTPSPTLTNTPPPAPTSSNTPRATATLRPTATAVPTATLTPIPTPDPTPRPWYYWWLPWLR